MCVGVPMQIVSVNGIAADCTDGRQSETVDLSLVGDLAPGTWVLTHLGCAREVISDTEARQIMAALDGLRAVMAGGEAGDAFADIDAQAPQLPPHLQAALDAGHSTG
ncbi:HypC/HybG/HupF family hydrogenase formation chaperone [Roseovarius sp.]|uniref:HypC/HybG/HupF family hydrogenase formation chaperone n=1 Tax=Roseovarius sp. TaxID=1486281 RepID=UPI0035664F93